MPEMATTEDGGEGVVNLTARQMEILTLVAKGYAQKEIAYELFLSPTTIKRNLQKIYEKLQARNGTHAVYIAFSLGLLPTLRQCPHCHEYISPGDFKVEECS